MTRWSGECEGRWKEIVSFLLHLNVQECMVHNQTIFNQININYFLFQLAPFDIPIFITNSTGHSSVTFMAHE